MPEKVDYYKLLGLSKKASRADIKKAYAKLARKYHPDVNPEDEELAGRYHAITEAYGVLSDAKDRKKYDRLGHAAYVAGLKSEQGGEDTGIEDAGSLEEETDILDEILSGVEEDEHRFAGGRDLEQTLELTLLEAAKGSVKDVKVERRVPCANCSDSKNIFEVNESCILCGGSGFEKITEEMRVRVPAGTDSDRKIRVKGKGMPGGEGNPKGGLYLTPTIEPHEFFWRQGSDLLMELPISYYEACLGAKIDVPTMDGWVVLTVPPGIQNGQKLRLKGKGVKSRRKKERGHQFVVIKVILPETVDLNERSRLEALQLEYPHNPREGLDWGLEAR